MITKGPVVLRDKTLYRSIAFTRAERDRLGLRGFLPHRVARQRQLVGWVMASLRRLPKDIDRYMALSSLQERNGRLFYRTVVNHIDKFPGVGLGAVVCRARSITDRMFLAAARALAHLVRKDHRERGALYPPLKEIRNISLAIATAVAEDAWAAGLARRQRPRDARRRIRMFIYHP